MLIFLETNKAIKKSFKKKRYWILEEFYRYLGDDRIALHAVLHRCATGTVQTRHGRMCANLVAVPHRDVANSLVRQVGIVQARNGARIIETGSVGPDKW